MSFSFKIRDISEEYSIENLENEEQDWNEIKNPYLKIDDVPELELIDKNNMLICDKKEYKIKEYIDIINNSSSNFLDDEIYNYCGKCEENINKFFCFICNKNICEKCNKKCKSNKHFPQNLEDIIDKNNINKIKKILSSNILPIKEEGKIIKNIFVYIDKNIINNDIKNPTMEDFSFIDNNEKNEDISLIYQIISKDYINYFHYLNIEKIFVYLKQEYKPYIKCKNDRYGKMIYENGEYYIGEFKRGLRHGKGILYYKNAKLIDFGYFDGNKFEQSGSIEYQIYDYYIGEWKDGLRHGKGLLCYKNKSKYIGDWINDKVEGNGKNIEVNGNYYIGEWKNGSKHGKGIIYYKNGGVKYEGDFINNEPYGKGKYIFDSGLIYIGEFKGGFMYGKGIIYDKNGINVYVEIKRTH